MADTDREDSPLLRRTSNRHHLDHSFKDDQSRPARTTSVWEKCRWLARLAPFAYIEFWAAALVSLTPAYFPPLATSKGLEAWQYGFVFSAFSVAVLPGTLLAQKLISIGSSRAGYLAGLVGQILFCFAFGTLYWIKDGGLFLAMSLCMVLLKGVLATNYDICVFGIMASAFTKTRGLYIAVFHCLSQIGEISGSSFGGILVDTWAFPAPFYAIGFAFALCLPSMMRLDPKKLGKEEASISAPPGGLPENEWRYYHLFWHPMFLINLLTIVIVSALGNFNTTTLEPYLSQFNLTNAEIGTLFAANYIADCGGSLLAGVISVYKMEKLLIFFGCFLSTLSYAIIGPAPFLPFKPTLTLIYTAQVLRGLGTSAMELGPFTDALRYIVETAGYPDTIQTNGFMSTMAHQSTIITNIAIPPMAGYLASTYGYRNGTMFMFAVLSIWTLITGCVWLKSALHRLDSNRTQ